MFFPFRFLLDTFAIQVSRTHRTYPDPLLAVSAVLLAVRQFYLLFRRFLLAVSTVLLAVHQFYLQSLQFYLIPTNSQNVGASITLDCPDHGAL